jgi:hypothetical protein
MGYLNIHGRPFAAESIKAMAQSRIGNAVHAARDAENPPIPEKRFCGGR